MVSYILSNREMIRMRHGLIEPKEYAGTVLV
jgi:hypothetical protein